MAIGILLLGLAVLGRGVRLIVDGRREIRAPGADPEDRMFGSIRLVGGVRWVGYGLVLVVVAAIAARCAGG